MKISTPPGCRLRRRSLGQTPPPGVPQTPPTCGSRPTPTPPLSAHGTVLRLVAHVKNLRGSLASLILCSVPTRRWSANGRVGGIRPVGASSRGPASALPLTTGSVLPPAPTSATSTSQPQACRPRRGPRPSLRPQPAPLPRTSDPRAGARPRAGVKLSEAFERQPAACKGTGPAPERGLPPVPVCPVLPWTAPDGSTRCEQTGRLRCRL